MRRRNNFETAMPFSAIAHATLTPHENSDRPQKIGGAEGRSGPAQTDHWPQLQIYSPQAHFLKISRSAGTMPSARALTTRKINW
jgi:hypothetical protein